MITRNMKILYKLFIMLALVIVAGCGTNNSRQDASNGTITANLAWGPDGKTAAKTVASAPVGVTTVRIIVSAAGMTTIQKDFSAASGSGSIGGVLVGTGRNLTVQGLNSSGIVTYQGTAANLTVQAGQTTNAGTITMVTVVASNAPNAPSVLMATAQSASRINLSWTDNSSNETGFKIERKTGTGGTYVQIGTATANATSYNDLGLVASTAYYYRLRATNTIGDSAYSTETSATTSASGGGTTVAASLIPKTGQTESYAAGDDGALQKGVAWPNPRFTDNANGTATDNLTGLIWLKEPSCIYERRWDIALDYVNTFKSLPNGFCNLTDGSTAGQWRLPNINELESLVDISQSDPALPSGFFFGGISVNGYGTNRYYWSSTSCGSGFAWTVNMGYGVVECKDKIGGGGGSQADRYGVFSEGYVWPVRDF